MNQQQDIRNINTLFAPLGLKVDEVIECAQSIKYKLNLPLDLDVMKKIKRAESTIEFAIPTTLGTTEFIYGRDASSIYIEKRSDDFKVVKFEENVQYLPDEGLLLLLGADDNGKRVYTDLRKAPHILVAGTTGSGKSELLHTFIASLVYRMTENPCEIVIIDPKRSEFSIYENRSHIDLITDVSLATKKLKECCDLMEERYSLIQANHCKDIAQLNDSSIHPVVIVIDELADLMYQTPSVEKHIVRLAQKARACGIHLILGTQSPRKDIITGSIKANIPTRIALHTSSALESRIIMERNGAENLFGNGDMLFLGNGAKSLVRIQAAYINNDIKEQSANCLPYSEHKTVQTEKKFDYNEYYAQQGYDLQGAIEWSKQYEREHPKEVAQPVKQKRLGIIGTLRNLMAVKPIMFRTDDYPPKI